MMNARENLHYHTFQSQSLDKVAETSHLGTTPATPEMYGTLLAAQVKEQRSDQENGDNNHTTTQRCALTSDNRIRKLVVGVILLSVIFLVVIDSFTTGYVRTAFEAFLKWIISNPTAGVFAFMGVCFAATILFLPGSILTLGSGFVFANAFGLGFGVGLASIAVFLGASTGAIAAFVIGRYLLRNEVRTLTKKYPVFEAIDRALGENGFRIMALLRLSPVIPFNALNYIAGTTAVSLLDYTLAMIAILPGTVFYVFLGATAGSLTDTTSTNSGSTKTTQIVTIILGVMFGALGVGVTTYYARQELRKIT